MVKVVGIDPGTFDSSSQYSIHWTSLTQDTRVTNLVPFHAAFYLIDKKNMGCDGNRTWDLLLLTSALFPFSH